MKTTITQLSINCGCGARFKGVAVPLTQASGNPRTVLDSHAIVQAQYHAAETGHTLEILGTISRE